MCRDWELKAKQASGPMAPGHYSNGVGQNKRNMDIFVSDVTFDRSVHQ